VTLKASTVFIRGKKKVGYSLEVKLKFKGAFGDNKVEGTIVFPEVADDEDHVSNVRVCLFLVLKNKFLIECEKSDADHDLCKRLVQEHVHLMKSLFEQFETELRDR